MVGPLNPFAAMAAVNPASERGQLQNERENKQAQDKTQSKAGFGLEASQETGDRDADGRQLLEFRQPTEEDGDADPKDSQPETAKETRRSIDSNRGNRLDLTG